MAGDEAIRALTEADEETVDIPLSNLVLDDAALLLRDYVCSRPDGLLDLDDLIDKNKERCLFYAEKVLMVVTNNLIGQGKLEARKEGPKGDYQVYVKK